MNDVSMPCPKCGNAILDISAGCSRCAAQNSAVSAATAEMTPNLPAYFIPSLQRCIQERYAQFRGRAPGYEYWWFFAAQFGLNSILQMLHLRPIAGLVSLGLLLPGIGVGVRRMHDIGKSGWNLLWGLIPVAGWIYVIYLLTRPTQTGSNKWGAPDPIPAPVVAGP